MCITPKGFSGTAANAREPCNGNRLSRVKEHTDSVAEKASLRFCPTRLGATDRAEHHIKLKPATNPVYIPAYRLPHSQRRVVEKQIKEMLEQGVIENSRSPWKSPLFWVPMKNGQFRPVIDFRRVNEVTQDERFPLPVLKDLLMSLGQGNKYFISLAAYVI